MGCTTQTTSYSTKLTEPTDKTNVSLLIYDLFKVKSERDHVYGGLILPET